MHGYVSGKKHNKRYACNLLWGGLEMPNAAAVIEVVTQQNQDVSEMAIRRKAVQVTAQLPLDTDDALRVLDLARKLLLEFVGR